MENKYSVPNHIYRQVGEQVQERINHLPVGGKMQDLPEELWHESFKFYMNDPTRKGGPNMRIIRLDPTQPSLTVTGFIFNKFVHPVENRYVTVREAARLQGFPDAVAFSGTLTSTQQQVGNAVPVPLAQAVLESVVRQLVRAKAVTSDKVTAVSLFSGAGGFDVGAEQVEVEGARINTLLCTDIWADACQTLQQYFGNRLSVVEADIAQIIDPLAFYQQHTRQAALPDIIYGGPPCQTFSQAGKQKGTADLRGTLVYDYVRFVEKLAPKAFVLENVSNLKGIDKGAVLRDLSAALRTLGYQVEAKVLSAADYGAPQTRKRLFVIGLRDEIGKPAFPLPTHSALPSLLAKPYKTVGEAFRELPAATCRIQKQALLN